MDYYYFYYYYYYIAVRKLYLIYVCTPLGDRLNDIIVYDNYNVLYEHNFSTILDIFNSIRPFFVRQEQSFRVWPCAGPCS